MSHPSTLFRFRLELSDIDRSVYETLDFRVAMHPSETRAFLLCRVLAFALNSCAGLEFSPGGLSDTDEPALRKLGDNGRIEKWIEIGSPSAKKLHKAAKAAEQVYVYAHRDAEPWLREMRTNTIHRSEAILVYALHPKFLLWLEGKLERDNRWLILHNEGTLTVTANNASESVEVARYSI